MTSLDSINYMQGIHISYNAKEEREIKKITFDPRNISINEYIDQLER